MAGGLLCCAVLCCVWMAGAEPTWSQDDAEVMVSFGVPATTATRAVSCKIGETTLAIHVAGEPLFNDTFCAKCDIDDSEDCLSTEAKRNLLAEVRELAGLAGRMGRQGSR